MHRRSLHIKKSGESDKGADPFPFNVPIIQNLDSLEFEAPVKRLVGENGSGKLMLLEAIACAAGSNTD